MFCMKGIIDFRSKCCEFSASFGLVLGVFRLYLLGKWSAGRRSNPPRFEVVEGYPLIIRTPEKESRNSYHPNGKKQLRRKAN